MKHHPAFDFPAEEELLRAGGWVKRGRQNRLIKSAPRYGQYFWVDFARDASPPEFVGEHPAIIVRGAGSVYETCSVVPVTTSPQHGRKHSYKLQKNPNPNPRAGDVWAVCDHVQTINLNRIRPFKNRTGHHVFPRVCPEDLVQVASYVRAAFPQIFIGDAVSVPQHPAKTHGSSPVHELAKRIERETGAKPPMTDNAPQIGPSGRPILTLAKKLGT